MFRIHFDPELGRFIIQVLIFGCFWKTVKRLNDKQDSLASHSFPKFSEALEYVKEIGLDKLYQDKSVNRFNEHMNHYQNNQQFVAQR